MQENAENGRLIQMAEPDWLTITTVRGKGTSAFTKWASQVIETEAKEGKKEEWKAMGYKGWRVGEIKAGARAGEEAIAIFSGESAVKYAGRIPLGYFKVTRFDLQITLHVSPGDPTLAHREYADLGRQNELRKRPRYIKLISSPTGTTLYVGKRTSAIMLRLYDKTHHYEKGKLGMYWRYEVEYKKDAAQRAFDRWNGQQNRCSFTVNQVASEFDKRGVHPGFSKWSKIDAIEVKAKIAGDQERIEWLTKCVAPVVVQLCFNGHTEAVLHSLKLNNVLSIKEKE